MPRAPFILLITLLVSSPSFATQLSEIHLKNGDQLTGEIVSQDAKALVVKSSLFGQLTIPRSQIASTKTLPAPPTPKPVSGTGVALGTRASGQPFSLWLHALHDTKGSMEFGFNQQSGRADAINATIRANAALKEGINSYNLDVLYFYGRYDGSVQTDRTESDFQWRHDLTPKRLFFQTNTSYNVDHVKLINLDLEQSAGLGVTVVKSTKQALNLGSGLTAQYRRGYGLGTDLIALGNAFEDYSFKFNERIDLKQAASVQYSPIVNQTFSLVNGQQVTTNDQATNYSIRFNVALESKLTHRISLNLHYDLVYDNVIFDPNLKSDQRISSTIGYTF